MGPFTQSAKFTIEDVVNRRRNDGETEYRATNAGYPRASGTSTNLREVDAKRVHIETIQEAGKALAESSQTLLHDLKMHHVRFKIGHGISQLSKSRLEGVERERRTTINARLGRLSEGRS